MCPTRKRRRAKSSSLLDKDKEKIYYRSMKEHAENFTSLAIDLDSIARASLGPQFGNAPLKADILRNVTSEDLMTLATKPKGSTTPALKKIRSVHHTVARLLASGMKAVQVSAAVGMCNSRISILKNDPAFGELLEFYKTSEADAFVDVRSKMISLGSDAAAEIHDRILDDPDSINTKTLVDVMTATLDRGGHSPVHKTESLTAVLSKQDILDIKLAAGTTTQVHDKFEVTQNALQNNKEPDLGTTIEGTPSDIAEAEEATWVPSEGDNL